MYRYSAFIALLFFSFSMGFSQAVESNGSGNDLGQDPGTVRGSAIHSSLSGGDPAPVNRGDNLVEAKPFSVYPNPAKDFFAMQCDLCGIFDEQDIKIKVVDPKGKKILESSGNMGQINQALNYMLPTLSPGFYWIHITSEYPDQFLKFIKQ